MSTATELKIAPTETHDVHEIASRELINELRNTSMVLYGMFVELVREFYRFQTPYIIGAPDVRWDKNPQTTGIWIDSELNWNASHPEFVPAIYVKLSPIQYTTEFGDDNPLKLPMNLKDGIYRYGRKGVTDVSFVHVGGTAGEACALCDNTRFYLSDFHHAIRCDYVLSKFYEKQCIPLQPFQPDSKEKWQSVTVFHVEWTEAVHIKLESPILKSVDFISTSDPEGLHQLRRYGIMSLRQGKPDQNNNTRGER